jgi:hypothetical protein
MGESRVPLDAGRKSGSGRWVFDMKLSSIKRSCGCAASSTALFWGKVMIWAVRGMTGGSDLGGRRGDGLH